MQEVEFSQKDAFTTANPPPLKHPSFYERIFFPRKKIFLFASQSINVDLYIASVLPSFQIENIHASCSVHFFWTRKRNKHFFFRKVQNRERNISTDLFPFSDKSEKASNITFHFIFSFLSNVILKINIFFQKLITPLTWLKQ